MQNTKFRAWVDGRMLHDGDKIGEATVGFLFIHNAWHIYLSHDEVGGLWLATGKYDVLEQYTGFVDKDGVEVCEGDILSCGDSCDCVEWREVDGMWVLAWGGSDDCLMLSDGLLPLRSKVIGNIHKNPELMKEERDDTYAE